MNVNELTGELLDYWGARAHGWKKWDAYPDCWLTEDKESPTFQHFHPSIDWAQGGPIIERERIGVGPATRIGGGWVAIIASPNHDAVHTFYADTPLIAAMRAFVASKYGDEVSDAKAQTQ